jgi:leucyl-tRNA synthetase
LRKLHQTIQKITEDFESRWHFNTSLAAIMELTNELYASEAQISPGVLREVLSKMVLLMGPFAPHMAEDLWAELGRQGPLLKVAWPAFDADLARDDQVEVVVQVNGRLRTRLSVARGTAQEELERLAKGDPKVVVHLDGKTVRKVIVVADKLVNIVAA